MNINNRMSAAGLYTNRCVESGGRIDQRAARLGRRHRAAEARAGGCHLSPSSHLIYRVSQSTTVFVYTAMMRPRLLYVHVFMYFYDAIK